MKKGKKGKKVKGSIVLSLLFVLSCMLWTDSSVYAEEGQPVGTPISTATEWNNAMKDTTGVDYYVAVPELKITTASQVTTNKRIDLNGNTVNFVGINAQVKLLGYEKHTDFTIFSSSEAQGVLKSSGHDSSNANVNPFMGFIRDARPNKAGTKENPMPNLSDDGQNSNLVVTFNNVKIDSKDEFTYLMWTKEVVFKGKIDIHTELKGVIATNITLYGNEADPNDPDNATVRSTTGTSEKNIGLGGGYAPTNFILDPEPGYGLLDKREADNHKFLIKKNAELYGENKGTGVNNSGQSVIYNFRHIENNGKMNILNKTTSSPVVVTTITNKPGDIPTATIKLNSGSSTEMATLNKTAPYGVLSTYMLDFTVDNPEKFDIRYFGTGVFFRVQIGYKMQSNFYITDMDHAVWSNDSKGIGNPINIWQEVDDFYLKDVTATSNGKIVSSNANLQQNFKFITYSRWSNDIDLPELIMTDKAEYNQTGKYYAMPNNEKLDGSTRYKLPDGSTVENRVAANAELLLTLGGKKYTTTADAEGK